MCVSETPWFFINSAMPMMRKCLCLPAGVVRAVAWEEGGRGGKGMEGGRGGKGMDQRVLDGTRRSL